MKKKTKKMELGIYRFFVACLITDTWHPRGDVEMIACVTK